MWITAEVELPQAVLDAQASGKLVFFVGAGASVAAPSSLPLFRDLAEQLATLAHVAFDPDVGLDYFLGTLPDTFDAHTQTQSLIARPGSTFNSTHAALISIAGSSPPLRVVTTNFDDHLAEAAKAAHVEFASTWVGPALPIGDDFEGLVHIHGSVRRPARELVLNDRDFGRAYLTYAWATRFLIPMFQQFTVVFVGYSHDDPIMRYLALGLPSKTPRFVFTEDANSDDPKWKRFGIEPVSYPVPAGDHSALARALQAWSSRSRMGQIEHAAQVRTIVAAGPTMTPVDRDYILDRLGREEGAREFASATEAVDSSVQVAWLGWLESYGGFAALFSGAQLSLSSGVLAWWFSRTFVASPDLNGAALQTLQRLGSSLHATLFDHLCWSTEELGKQDPNAARRWRAYLATSIVGHSAALRGDSLLPYFSTDTVEHSTILRAVMRPQLTLTRRWNFGGSEDPLALPAAEVSWSVDEHHLTAHLTKLIEQEQPGDQSLGAMLIDSLLSAYELDEAFRAERGEWDGLSFGRSAIEPHDQDQFRTPLDAIVDGLRQYGEGAVGKDRKLIDRWWSLSRGLFQRLAVYLLPLDESRSSDDRINWLLDRDTLYAHQLKHEVYGVLASELPNASDRVRRRLLRAARRSPDYPEDDEDRERQIAYSRFNLLVWLTSAMPSWRQAVAARKSLSRKNPTFGAREHPDFDTWTTVGDVVDSVPMQPEEFIASWRQDPDGTLRAFVERDFSESTFDGPTWRTALRVVAQVSESYPDIGNEIWSVADTIEDLDDDKGIDLRIAVVDGWGKTDLAGLNQATERVRLVSGVEAAARSVSRFLVDQVRRQIDSGDSPQLTEMRRIARELWQAQAGSFAHGEGTDPVSMAPLYLNSWPGEIAQYWIAEIDRRWRNNRADWAGLDADERAALTDLLDGTADARDATLPALAGEIFFLFGADSEFATEHLLQLFRTAETSRLAWKPYLYHPRFNDRLLAAGLLEATISQWSRLDEIRDRAVEFNFYGLVTSIVSFAGISEDERQRLLAQSVLANDGDRAADFADAVTRFVRDEHVNGAEVWTQWLRQHLTNRLAGLPRIARTDELAAWADVVPYLGEYIPDAIELLSGRGIGLSTRYLQPDFSPGALQGNASEFVLHYAERIRNSSPGDHMTVYRIQQLAEVLRNELGDFVVAPVVEAALERGFQLQV